MLDLANGTTIDKTLNAEGWVLEQTNTKSDDTTIISKFAYAYLCKGQAGSCFVERGYGFCLPFCWAG